MKLLPKLAKLTLLYCSTSTKFTVVDADTLHEVEAFQNCSTINLHDVTIDYFGHIHGTYIKPKKLDHYDENVDKNQHPNYISWLLKNRTKVDIDVEYKYKNNVKWLMSNGNINSEMLGNSNVMDSAVIQIRIPFGSNLSYISIIEKERI